MLSRAAFVALFEVLSRLGDRARGLSILAYCAKPWSQGALRILDGKEVEEARERTWNEHLTAKRSLTFDD